MGRENMTSFGKPKVGGKFYYGDPRDTPWNRDLLYKKFVAKEAMDMERPLELRLDKSSSQIADMVHPGNAQRRPLTNTPKRPNSALEIRQAEDEVKLIERKITKAINDEKRRRVTFEANLASLEARLKAAKAKQVNVIQKKLD